MNIDIESIGLLSLILQDSPKDRQLILCVLARSNSVPTRITFNPNTDYPTFYGYSNSRIPLYLMGKGVVSNVPREGFAKRIISSNYLSRAETIINRSNNWDIPQKLFSVSKFITLDNKTAYKDAEVFLVFRDKALDYIKDHATNQSEAQPQNNSNLQERYKQLIDEIKSKRSGNDKTQQNKAKISNYSFNLTDNVLSINGKQIKFRKDTRKLALLKLLVKSKSGIYYSEVAEKLEGVVTDEIKNTKNVCYEACRGLENSFAKIGITDFLKFDYNQAKINSLYKRAS